VQGVQAYSQKLCFVANLGKISNILGKEVLTFFNSITEIILLPY